MLSVWNPFFYDKKLSKLSSRSFDNLFNDLFHTSAWGMEYKKNEDGSLAVAIDVPGVKEQDITIEVTPEQVLTVKGERKTATSSHSICKSFYIPEGYDSENINAELKDGVLTLTLTTKLPPNKEVKKIKINSKD